MSDQVILERARVGTMKLVYTLCSFDCVWNGLFSSFRVRSCSVLTMGFSLCHVNPH